MPLLFSYGTLQQDEVQISTFGRRLEGERGAAYCRVAAVLASRRRAWVYVDVRFAPPRST